MENLVTHRREKHFFLPPYLEFGHSGDCKNHDDGSSVAQSLQMEPGLCQALKKENSFSSFCKFRLFILV